MHYTRELHYIQVYRVAVNVNVDVLPKLTGTSWIVPEYMWGPLFALYYYYYPRENCGDKQVLDLVVRVCSTLNFLPQALNFCIYLHRLTYLPFPTVTRIVYSIHQQRKMQPQDEKKNFFGVISGHWVGLVWLLGRLVGAARIRRSTRLLEIS